MLLVFDFFLPQHAKIRTLNLIAEHNMMSWRSWPVRCIFGVLILAHLAANAAVSEKSEQAENVVGGCTHEGGERVLLAIGVEDQLRREVEDRDVQIRRLEARLRSLEDVEKKVTELEAKFNSHRADTQTLNTTVKGIEQVLKRQESQDLAMQDTVQGIVSSLENPMDTGEMAFMFNCIMNMLMMTIPGLALFYGGLVRMQNVLSTVMQSFSICCLITVLWVTVGYSLSFAEGSPVFGGSSRFWLVGMDMTHGHPLKPEVPEPVFVLFNLMFAIITPALISGAFADRMKFGPMLLFIALWHVLVYCPLAHASWHPEGFLHDHGVLDFAGGNVIHVAAGISGLVASIMVGKRIGFGLETFHAHNMLLSVLGASLLWVGWLGFNGGSFPAGKMHLGALAMLNTQIAGATASLSWMVTEWIIRKRPSVLGIISGSIAGLVTITPGAGFVDLTGAFVSGFLAGPFCYFSAQMKHRFGYDDALDAFGIHAPGGVLGGILTGLLATGDASNGVKGVFYGGGWKILGLQIYGIVVSILWSCVMTYLLLKAIEMLIGLRVNMEEENGLDMLCHGESIMPFPSNMSGLHYSDDEKLTGDRNSRRASSNNAFGGLGGTMGGRVSLEMARQRNISGAYTHASDEEEGHAAPSHSQAGSHREPHRSPLAAAAGGSSGLAPRVEHRVSAHTNVVLSAAYGAERHPATHTVGLA